MTFMHDQDDAIIVPVTTAMYRLLGKEYVDFIDVEVKNRENHRTGYGFNKRSDY